ncbi:MAG: dihydrolipoyl dehydrogenase [Planctomycetes bacterium]|nr:dihydrolipoyl dehydrogenase [Planctomycetota bacterium]MBL7145688.1 dihydrolipoyl dehydrogenase [Phycisphaerae bacterium]
MAESFDVVVIGSGPGGYAAAIRCVQRGASVAVVEKGDIGGTCLNCGCIPSKTLLASAHTLLMIKHAAMMGIDVNTATANWPKIQARKDAVVGGFRKGLTGLIKSHKVEILQGRAVVTEPNQIKVETETVPMQVQAGKIILATGSQPSQIPTVPFDGQTVISSKEALGLQQIPSSMVIIGGGVIGCEMACVYAAMGTKVTIVEALSRLIPMEDQWVGRLIEREFKKLGIDSHTGQKVTSVDTTVTPARVMLENGQTIDAEKVLVSVGRRAVVDEETVQALNLQMNGPAIAVNKKLETNAPGVYAIGDAVGTTYLAHGAFAEAEVAAVNATGGDENIADYSLIPRAVYTFPEIASVGKSEETCIEQGLDVSVGKSFFKANGRSVAHNETIGEIRAVRDNSTNKIIGVTMVGSMVTEMIGAARTLIGSTEKITDISFPHPTVSEVLKEAAEDAFGLSLHNPPKA